MAWLSPDSVSAVVTARESAGAHHGLELATPRQRRRDLVVAPDADDLLDQVVLLGDVAAEARHHDLERQARVIHGESQALKNSHGFLVVRADADEPLDA